MKLIRSLLDYVKPWTLPDVYLFTGNPIIKNNGAVVMGRGAALQVRDTYPGIDKILGATISLKPGKSIYWVYPSAVLNPKMVLGWFKVKDHWAAPAQLELIQASTRRLQDIAIAKPNITFHMNYPGVGNGRLTEADVGVILSTLPDNVRIYR